MSGRRWLGASFVAVVVLVGCSDRASPAQELHRTHRVQLDVPPVEAALWFAARYPQYFISGEAQLRPWLDSLEARERDFVIAMGQTLAWAWVEHEVEAFDHEDPGGLAREVTSAIRHETLSQIDFNVGLYPDVAEIEFDAYVGDPDFAAGVFARLVRGVSNCEGQNHLVGLLLDAALESKAIDAVVISTGRGHELVKLQGPMLAQAIYVDAWSNLPAFTLERSAGEIPTLAQLGDPPPRVVPEFGGKGPFSAAVYAESTPTAIELLVARDAPTKPVDLDVRAPPLDEASLARVNDPWRLYLFARILHVFDDPRAGELYRLVIDRYCDGGPHVKRFVCAASLELRERWARG